jgi:hypothetical protein
MVICAQLSAWVFLRSCKIVLHETAYRVEVNKESDVTKTSQKLSD